MSERIYAFDSSKTAIGPVEGWSPALRVMVRFLLANRFPLLLWWGPDIAYGPVPDESTPTGIGGVLGTVHEITEKVVSERRVAALRVRRRDDRNESDARRSLPLRRQRTCQA
jgi:hypothetical protein